MFHVVFFVKMRTDTTLPSPCFVLVSRLSLFTVAILVFFSPLANKSKIDFFYMKEKYDFF